MTALLRLEKIRAERILSSIRLSFFAIALLLNIVNTVIQRRPFQLETYLILAAVLFSSFAYIELRYILHTGRFMKRIGTWYFLTVILFDVIIITTFVHGAYTAMLDPHYAARFPFAPMVVYAGGFIILSSLYLVLDIFRFSPLTTVYSAVLLIAAYMSTAHFILPIPIRETTFQRSSEVFVIVTALSAVLCALVSREISRVMVLSKRQEQLSRFLPQAQALKYMKNSQALLPGGEKRTITIVFADIRGFTSMSEDMPPQDTINFLNAYFKHMVEPIFAHGGMLDKYIGDGIMALFGAPESGERDADNAVGAAIGMREQLIDFNLGRAKAGLAPIEICIGIHSGEAILGNIGTERRMDYTAIGDAVNTAARLEQLNRNLNTSILISEECRCQLHEQLPLQDMGKHTVRGRRGVVHVYAL